MFFCYIQVPCHGLSNHDHALIISGICMAGFTYGLVWAAAQRPPSSNSQILLAQGPIKT